MVAIRTTLFSVCQELYLKCFRSRQNKAWVLEQKHRKNKTTSPTTRCSQKKNRIWIKTIRDVCSFTKRGGMIFVTTKTALHRLILCACRCRGQIRKTLHQQKFRVCNTETNKKIMKIISNPKPHLEKQRLPLVWALPCQQCSMGNEEWVGVWPDDLSTTHRGPGSSTSNISLR